MFTKLCGAHGALRSNMGAGSEETTQLKAKIEELNNKVSKLMTEKMELLEQAHSTLTSGSSHEKKIAVLENDLLLLQKQLSEKDVLVNEDRVNHEKALNELREMHDETVGKLKEDVRDAFVYFISLYVYMLKFVYNDGLCLFIFTHVLSTHSLHQGCFGSSGNRREAKSRTFIRTRTIRSRTRNKVERGCKEGCGGST